MGEKNPILILKYLYKHDCSPEFTYLNDFFISDLTFDKEKVFDCHRAVEIIYELGKAKYLEYKIEYNSEKVCNPGEAHRDRLPGSIENIMLWVKLTQPGLEHTRNIIRQEENDKLLKDQHDSNIATSQSVRDTNSLLNKTSVISIVLAFVTTLFIILTFWKECNNNSEREIKGVKEALKQQDSTLRNFTPYIKSIDSSLKKAVKDSFYKHR